jgi:hypothetical protein
VADLKAGRLKIVAQVDRLDGREVVLRGDRTIEARRIAPGHRRSA